MFYYFNMQTGLKMASGIMDRSSVVFVCKNKINVSERGSRCPLKQQKHA